MDTYTGSANAPVASRELQIPAALDELQKEIERAMKVSEDLSMRLEKICTPNLPKPDGNPNEKDMPRAEYVENLRQKAAKIRKISELLEDVMQRLEL